MPRSPLIRTSDFPYHVTVRSNNKEWFYIPQREVWALFAEYLCATSERYGIRLHSFVLMSNHCHMTVTTPRLNLDLGMRYLLTEVSRKIGEVSGRINHVFGGRYKPTVVTNPVVWSYVFKYVYRNPVRAGICGSVADYAYSTLNCLDGGGWPFPVSEEIRNFWQWIPNDRSERLNWLDQPTPKEVEELMQLGFRRSTFQLSEHGRYNGARKLLDDSYGRSQTTL